MSRKLPQVTRRTLEEIARDAAAEPDGPRTAPGDAPGDAPGEPPGEQRSAAPEEAPTAAAELRRIQALALVDRFVAWSAIGGAVPLPLIDLVSIAALQVQMVRRLAAHYHLPFSAEAVRSTLLSAAAATFSSGGGNLAGNLAGLLLARSLPLAPLLNMWVASGLAVVTTLAIGRAYVLHFESGGTALDLDPATLAAHYRRALAERGAA